MKKSSKIMSVVVMVVLCMSLLGTSVFAAETFKVTATGIPSDWTGVGIWAWGADDLDLIGSYGMAAWPGPKMAKDGDNYTYELPIGTTNLVINEGVEGGKQTVDLTISGKKDVTITIKEAGEDGKFAADIKEGAAEADKGDSTSPKTDDETPIVAMLAITMGAAVMGLVSYKNAKRA